MGFRGVRFTDVTIGIGTSSVEIAQGNPFKAMRVGAIAQHLLHRQLRPCIGTEWGRYGGFINGLKAWRAVNGTSTGKHQPINAAIMHGGKQAEATLNIMPPIYQRVGYRLPHCDQSGKMGHCYRPVPSHDIPQKLAIQQAPLLNGPPLHRPSMAVCEVVVCNGKKARPVQSFADMAADIPRPSSHQNHTAAHGVTLTKTGK